MNTLLLYAQVGINGRLVATSGYVAVPHGPAPAEGWPVVTRGHGTTGIADQCAITRGGGPHDRTVNDPLLEHWLQRRMADTTVFPAFDQGLAKSLAAVGDQITYHTYPGAPPHGHESCGPRL